MNPKMQTGGSARELLPSLTAGLLNGMLVLIFQSAYAALIFAGPLAAFLPQGTGILLFGAIVMSTVVSLLSGFSTTVTAPQDAPTAIMAVVAAAIATQMGMDNPQSTFWTIVIGMGLTALASGLFLWLLGQYKLGNLIRFIPYPVVGGFLAGTGWVLVKGAVAIMAGITLNLETAHRIFEGSLLLHWLPGVLYGIVLLIVQKRFRHFLVMPSMILGAIILFYGVLFLSQLPIAEARALGWLPPSFPGDVSWSPPSPEVWGTVDWAVLTQQAGNLATIMIISVISLLLNASGMELIVRKEVDLNRELKVTGLANLLSGLGSSSVGYMSLSLSAFGYRLGSRHRLTGLTVAAICAVGLFSGAGISAFFPRPLLGGLLFFLGLSFLVEWLYQAWFRLPRMEYGLVILILLTIGVMGFLPGMLVGMLIATVLFAVNYGRIGVIKHSFTGSSLHSNVDRSLNQKRRLNETGDQRQILELQGYIFFGTANAILEKVKRRLYNPDKPDLRFVVLDFRMVPGLDSSALNSFQKMLMLCESRNCRLIFTGLIAPVRGRLKAGKLLDGPNSPVRTFPDLDHGLEWIENQVLELQEGKAASTPETIEALRRILQDSLENGSEDLDCLPLAEQLAGLAELRELPLRGSLIRQGDQPTGLYIVLEGEITAQLEDGKGGVVRLRKMGPGAIIGEMGLYMNTPASASVIANSEARVLFISKAVFEEMENSYPATAAAVHRWVIRILGERLAAGNRTLQALLR